MPRKNSILKDRRIVFRRKAKAKSERSRKDFETVFFWKDIERGFKEVRRVLKDGAAFAVVNNYGDPKIDWEKKVPCMTRYTASQIKTLMENAGFGEVSVSENGTLFCVQGRVK